jgi:hypothetical protein
VTGAGYTARPNEVIGLHNMRTNQSPYAVGGGPACYAFLPEQVCAVISHICKEKIKPHELKEVVEKSQHGYLGMALFYNLSACVWPPAVRLEGEDPRPLTEEELTEGNTTSLRAVFITRDYYESIVKGQDNVARNMVDPKSVTIKSALDNQSYNFYDVVSNTETTWYGYRAIHSTPFAYFAYDNLLNVGLLSEMEAVCEFDMDDFQASQLLRYFNKTEFDPTVPAHLAFNPFTYRNLATDLHCEPDAAMDLVNLTSFDFAVDEELFGGQGSDTTPTGTGFDSVRDGLR